MSHTQPGKTPFVSPDYMFGIPLCFMAIALCVKILQMVDLWPYTGSGAWNSPPEHSVKKGSSKPAAAADSPARSTRSHTKKAQ